MSTLKSPAKSPLNASLCPCGGDKPLADCCGRYHAGELAPTPEALMRSRYSAFVLNLTDYLLASWHPSTRPANLAPDSSSRWLRLEILESAEEGGKGQVAFRAVFKEGRRWAVLEETSRFVREEGRWFYLDGTPDITRLKPGRNDYCLCGSLRKFKSCCGI
ncbi:zinc chelation protein SecC [Halomonas sp. ZH2S]|uniref:UPF0225 protein GPM19_04470 n=1 Tax=Vreelandella zhuhanensis TaxID=2684210 RepID=A0A7X3GYW7_9GAMM|nr:YchJ family protein [Halomonas zhuhanensis]MWJ27467.1 zinc chelation protein SecC [Halomonas zhuhanensis]